MGRIFVPIQIASITATRIHLYKKAVRLVPQALKKLYTTGRIDSKKEKVGPIYKAPNNWKMFEFFVKRLFR